MSAGRHLTTQDEKMFTPSELASIRRWQTFSCEELAVIRRWQVEKFTPAELAVISCWQASRLSKLFWDTDGDIQFFLRRKEALVWKWTDCAARRREPHWAPSVPSWAPYPHLCDCCVPDIPPGAVCCKGCFMCSTFMVLRDLCRHILWDLPEHRCSQKEWSEADLTAIIRHTDLRRWEIPEDDASSPAPQFRRDYVPSWRQYEANGRICIDVGYVCRRSGCYQCAGAVLLRHNYPRIFGDVPMDACDIYETWFYDHRSRFLAARHVPAVPCEPPSKRSRQGTS